MSLKSSPTRFGAVAIAIHWLTALAILLMLISGLAAVNTVDAAVELNLLRAHATMGALVGVLTLLRIVWWLFFDRRPADAATLSRGQALASHLVHYALYAVVLVMVASGIATVLLSGAGAQLTGAALLPLPDFEAVLPFHRAWAIVPPAAAVADRPYRGGAVASVRQARSAPGADGCGLLASRLNARSRSGSASSAAICAMQASGEDIPVSTCRS